MILIQHFTTRWTKATRGAQGATLRASIPEALGFPCPELPDDRSIWLHMVAASEGENFELRQDIFEHPAEESILLGFFEVLVADDSIRARFTSNTQSVFDTSVSERPAPFELLLQEGRTLQWRAQNRIQGWNEPWYERQVLNIAWLKRYDSEVFRLRPFSVAQDDLPKLF